MVNISTSSKKKLILYAITTAIAFPALKFLFPHIMLWSLTISGFLASSLVLSIGLPEDWAYQVLKPITFLSFYSLLALSCWPLCKSFELINNRFQKEQK